MIPPKRFLILNIIGAAIWASVIGVCGYLFGQTLEIVIDDVKRYEILIFSVLGMLGIVLWIAHFIKKRNGGKT